MPRQLRFPDSLRLQIGGVCALAGLVLAGVFASQILDGRARIADELVAEATEEAASGLASLGAVVAATSAGIASLVRAGEAASGEAGTLRDRVAAVSTALRAA